MRIAAITTRPLPTALVVPAKNSDCSSCEEGKSDAASQSGQIKDSLELSSTGSQEGESVDQLSEEEQEQVEQLKARDREVRAHEQAHLAAAGPYARGGPSYTYQTGPDGQRYAIGGEVQIDTSAESDPEATLQKARVIRAAALAPAEPSSQDRAVAAVATKMEVEARREIIEEQRAEQEGASSEGSSDESSARLTDVDGEDFVGKILDLVA